MGVTGLWRLIEPAGKPVPIETLENKVLAVDISIWLHQVVKGYQDARGAPMPNAHLMGLFQRLCKLLYFRIKPVFVFDGGFPELKKETIAKRHDSKTKYNSESERLKRELAILLSKKTAIGSILGNPSPPKKAINPLQQDDELFKLPELPQKEVESESESDDEDTSSGSIIDLHSVDVESEAFKTMPVKEKYDLLLELKETRKMNSWGRLHELPKKSDNFSDFQMQRLLKRRKVQECLAKTEQEMGVNTLSLNEIESLLNEEGIETKIDSLPTCRIASSDTTRYLLIKDLKKVRSEIEAKKVEERVSVTSNIQYVESEAKKVDDRDSTTKNFEYVESEASCSKKAKVDELEEDLQKAIKMSLECVNTDTDVNTTNSSQSDFDSSMWESYSSSSEEELTLPDMSSAKAYIMQYSDFTHKAIENIVSCTKVKTKKVKPINVEDIIEELNAEKTVIVDNVELVSEDECGIDKIVKDTGSDVPNTKEVISEQNNSLIIIDSNTSQSSIDLVVNSAPEVINLDSSVDETNLLNLETKLLSNTNSKNIEISSESSDEDFEEVIDDNDKFVKPIVQINLNMGAKPEDDIFADIFTQKPGNQQKADEKHDYTNPINKMKQSKLETKLLENYNNENIKKSSDEEFEEVIDPTNQFVKPVIQPSLNVKTASDDDIIADEFNENPENNIKKEIKEFIHINNKVKEINNKVTESEINKRNSSKPTVKCLEETMVNDKLITNATNSPEKVEVVKEIEIENPAEPLTREELNTMVDKLEERQNEIVLEKGRLDRIGRNITEEMTRDVKELLRIFGIPYIVAPMEAEAQCAFLESIKLTDGTITDDSDIWLFGGQTVYKNFFNQKKHVLQFVSDRIEKSFNLSREQLVLLALLVGSDYTTGVMGVGPVTAMEILASFPYNKNDLTVDLPKQLRYTKLVNGLQEFKKWVKSGKRTENTVLKKKLRNVDVSDDFPSTRVVQAYFEPNVNKNDETFTWGEINVTILRDYTKTKFGWSQCKFDEIINPVIKRLVERKSQMKIQDFFKRKVDYESLEEQMSKRVKAAVQRMGPDNIAEVKKDSKKPKRKRKIANKEITVATETSNEPSTSKDELKNVVRRVTETEVIDSKMEIKVPKLNRYQEIIPQREKDKKHLLENRLKAIEIFRKSTIDKKVKKTKKKVILPKDDAGLSESDSD